MKLTLVALLAVVALPLHAADASSGADCRPTVTGKLDIFDLQSSTFGNSRKLRVWLPPGYSDSTNERRYYPVLYIFDAQNVFDICTSYAHKEWQVDETLTRLIGKGKVEPLIVVGIDHAGERRAYEWLPWQDNIQNPGGGPTGGVRLTEFMVKDVMPAAEARYRIRKGPENTAIAGSSYGGVAALYVGIMAPTVFGKVLGESPVLWVGNGQLVRDTVGIPMAPSRTYLGYGMKEWKLPGENETSAKMLSQLAANLRSATFKPGEVRVEIDPDATHDEDAWARRFPEAIQFLFPRNAVPAPPSVETKHSRGN
ncbi:MAG: alpha/beta hydrolase [Alphaproteobacteria bacterium]|nr:alpha/beta hydrolase [Alphaproteobacteria bacterium]MDE2630795.1 alpha/beta hydrolase [Alphaproteobacteria bacterium]